MINKKGDFLVDNTLSIIVAVIGIALLAVLVYNIYSVTVHQEIEDVKTVLDSIGEKIENVGEGNEGTFTVRGINTGDDTAAWILVGFDKSEGLSTYRPKKCFGSCMCVCKVKSDSYGEGLVDFFFVSKERKSEEIAKEVRDSCNEGGLCKDFEVDRLYFPGGGVVLKDNLVEFNIDWTDENAMCIGIRGTDNTFECVRK